ncbi:pseudouridine synthase family protein [Campylobacter portucalensis]|nr:RluA family pseudouridine synthase [Campylobacter portucalensis]
MLEKAYKILALQENISNNEAKKLIDNNLVFIGNKRLNIARQELNSNTKFRVLKIKKPSIIFEDKNIIAVNKPNFIISESLEKIYKARLLNRLDRETSGVVLLSKSDEFRKTAINEFKNLRVKKSYIAIVSGIISEDIEINEPILTIKGKNGAFSKISSQGKQAVSFVTPLMISGKKSLIKIDIKTGRTHQIRVHLSSIDHHIIGDEKYSKKSANRMYLHSYKTELLDYKFIANLDESFNNFGFEITKNMKF